MSILIKRMETEREIRGKAYVHWKSWQEAYPGLVRHEFLDRLSLEKCEQIAFGWQDGMLIAKDGENVVGFVGYGRREGTLRTHARFSPCMFFPRITNRASAPG